MRTIPVLIVITVIISIKVSGLDLKESPTLIRVVVKPYPKNVYLRKRTGRNMSESSAKRHSFASDSHHKIRTSAERSFSNTHNRNNSWREIRNERFSKHEEKDIGNYADSSEENLEANKFRYKDSNRYYDDNSGENEDNNNEDNLKYLRNSRNNKEYKNDTAGNSGSNNFRKNRNHTVRAKQNNQNNGENEMKNGNIANHYRSNRDDNSSGENSHFPNKINSKFIRNGRKNINFTENGISNSSIDNAFNSQPYVIKLDKNRDLLLPNKKVNQKMQPLETVKVHKFYPHDANDQIHLNSYKSEKIMNNSFDLQTSASNIRVNKTTPDLKLPLLIMKTDVTPQKFQSEANAIMKLQNDPKDFNMLLGGGDDSNGLFSENKKLVKGYKKAKYVVRLPLPQHEEGDEFDDKHYKEYKPEQYFTGEELELFHQGKLKYDMNVAPQIEIVEEKGHSEEYVESETRDNQQVTDKHKEDNNAPDVPPKTPHEDIDSYDHYDYGDTKHKRDHHKNIHQIIDDIYNSSDEIPQSTEVKQAGPRKKRPRQKNKHLLKITNMRKPTSIF